MSLPSFPDKDKLPTREEVVNQIISSIAMEELGLSHIINAEGEKLQYALGTIPGVNGPEEPMTMDDLLKLNESVHKTLDSTVMNQFFLKEKLINALSASVMQGPVGPVGTISGSYESLADLEKEHPKGKQGDTYLVVGELYVWDTENKVWKSVGNLMGPAGPTGAAGASILGVYDDFPHLISEHPTGTKGDAYLVGGVLYVWVENESGGSWENMGSIVGPAGPTGDRGPTGTGIEILGSYDTIDELRAAHPIGEQGEVYAVNGVLHYWDDKAKEWLPIENLHGPTGPAGPSGETGGIGPQGDQGIQGPEGAQGPQGEPGRSGVIEGVFNTEADLIAEHPTGVPSEFYLVGNINDGYSLYVWNSEASPPEWINTGAFTGAEGPQGPQGPAGPQGPEGNFESGGELFLVKDQTSGKMVSFEGDLTFESNTLDISVESGPTVKIENPAPYTGSLIPFATGAGKVDLLKSNDGWATNVIFAGYGSSSSAVSITSSGFTLPSGDGFFYPISLARDIKIKSIHFTTANYDAFNPGAGAKVIPYIMLAVANQGENSFHFLQETKVAVTTPWLGGSQIPENSTRYGFKENINQIIPLGARLVICCAFDMEGGNPPWIPGGYYLYYSGSVCYD